MCGITGIVSVEEPHPIARDVLAAMNESIRHRGPDSDGFHVEEGRVGIAMRRLAIIDVAGGDQPIANEDESVWVVYNGEIYNFHELRRELEAAGHRFRTHADTEVLVHAYEEFGDDFVGRLRGMFAFALWDSRRKRLVLGRDRVGIKQLFFTRVGRQLLFGSEIKALLAHPQLERRLRPAAVNHFLAYLYVPEPLTLFEGIQELRAGHLLVVEEGRVALRPYWSLRYQVEAGLDFETAAEGLRERLDEAVRIRLISEVPLGAFLSGGIDSGSVVALMARHSNSAVNTFSIGYASGGEAFDERAYAREVAARYGTAHREFELEPDVVAIAPELVRAFDQPCADSTAIPTWYLCQHTRRFVTVALSGLGGDELAAGYERHRGAVLAERLGWIPPWLLRRMLRPLVDALPDPKSGSQWPQRAKRFVRTAALAFDDRYYQLLVHHTRERRAALLTPELLEQIDLDEPRAHFHSVIDSVREAAPLNRALFADLRLYLPGDLLTLSDRTSMAHSLEVRVPFLDHELLEFAARIPPEHKLRGMERKAVLKRAVADLLPPSFLGRRKMGFSAPLAVWFREELRSFVEDTLSPDALRRAGVFRPEAVREILDDHFRRRANYDNQIWGLLCFMIWHRQYLESAPGLPVSGWGASASAGQSVA
jgi:asparagine synthase (glutamine-hydrolysing)